MERRGFIKGMLASIAGTTAMVKLAEPGEAAALVAQRDLLLSQPEPTELANAQQAIQAAPEVFARIGNKFVSIGYIQSIEVTAPVHDIYSWEGRASVTNPEAVMGLRRMSMTFAGPIR